MIRVALATRVTARASAGMRAYAAALRERLPRVAPGVELVPIDAPLAVHPIALRAAGADLVHLPYLEAAPFVPRPYVAMLHDLTHLHHAALFSRATAAYWRFVARPLYRGADLLLVSDARVAEDCVAMLGVRRERLRIVPLGYHDAIPAAPPWESDRPYLFYAGNHLPHKGLVTLYAAWAMLPDDMELDLVLTGRDEPAVRARWRRSGGSITFLGELDAATLARRYRGALAYVQPSLTEGFGIPVLEAAVAGTPVLATPAALPSIVAPYARSFPAGDEVALATLIFGVVHDPAAARERAAEGAVVLRAYTWDRFAASTAAVYREVVCP